MDLVSILQGPNGASVLGAVVGSSFLLLGWLANKLFDTKMKQLENIARKINIIEEKVSSIHIDMSLLKGKVERIDGYDRKIEDVQKSVWTIESQVKAAWRALDQIKPA